MNIYVILGLILVVFILIFTVIKIVKSNSNNNENDKLKTSFKRHLIKVNLPAVVQRLRQDELRELAREELSTYKALGYKNKLLKDMVDIQWHTWQVSVIIKMYKEDMDIFFPNYKDIFPKELIDQSTYTLEKKLYPIFERYNKDVSINGTKKYLREQIIWTSKDISILLLFLIKYKKDENYKYD
jgi:hypothetical protein